MSSSSPEISLWSFARSGELTCFFIKHRNKKKNKKLQIWYYTETRAEGELNINFIIELRFILSKNIYSIIPPAVIALCQNHSF
jgi:hypothetical protein